MTQQTINPPVRPALSEIDFNYGQIRRDMLARRVGKVLLTAHRLGKNNREGREAETPPGVVGEATLPFRLLRALCALCGFKLRRCY